MKSWLQRIWFFLRFVWRPATGCTECGSAPWRMRLGIAQTWELARLMYGKKE